MVKKYCVYCEPFGLPKGQIFHPEGEKVECSNCKRTVRKGQIVCTIYLDFEKRRKNE